MRPSEAFRLTWSDWDTAGGTIRVAPGKTGAGRIVPVAPWLAESLRKVRARRGVRWGKADDHILLGQRWAPYRRDSSALGRLWRQWLAAAGLPERWPDGTVCDRDSLRHTYAHRLKDAGVPIAQAMQLMGHRSERMLLGVYGRALLDTAWTPPPIEGGDREEAKRG